MAEAKKVVKSAVADIIENINSNESKRFSKGDFQTLVYGVLSDKDFNAEKWIQRGDELVAETYSISDDMRKFLHKLLKHAGLTDVVQRDHLIETFEYNPKDINFVIDAVEEAMYQYTECGKNLVLFRDKMLRMSVKKITRTGKYEGKITYKKSVVDRKAALAKRKSNE